MTQFNRKDTVGLLTAFAAIAFIPCVILFTRPRPIHADSPSELAAVAHTIRRGEVFAQMDNYQAVDLNFQDPTSTPDLNARWQLMQTMVQNAGANSQDSQKIVNRARAALGSKWPCIIEKGYIRDREVWIVIGSQSLSIANIPWIDQPNSNDIERAKSDVYDQGSQVVILDAESHQLLN